MRHLLVSVTLHVFVSHSVYLSQSITIAFICIC
uniref:Uncharacterized protein n=1 Tax=Triticum urartu TaxID=4572 RepID=A0A8R7TI71_TRIUA